MSISNYLIITSTGINELVDLVNDQVKLGFQPFGDVFGDQNRGIYRQAMTKGSVDGGANVNDGDSITQVDYNGISLADSVAIVDGSKLTVKLDKSVAAVLSNNAISVRTNDGKVSSDVTATVSDGMITNLALHENVSIVNNGDVSSATNKAKTYSATGTVTVTSSGGFTGISLDPTFAIVQNELDVNIKTADGSTFQAPADIDNGELLSIDLDNTIAIVSNAQAKKIAVAGTYKDTVTFAVADGAISSITLS